MTTEVMDVGRPQQADEVVRRVGEESAPIEVLICAAGVIQVGPLAALTRADFVEAVDVMLWGPVNTALAVLPGMRERGRGRIGIPPIEVTIGVLAGRSVLHLTGLAHGVGQTSACVSSSSA